MCNLYTHRRPQEAMRQLFAGLDDRGVNLAPADFYPDQRAPIIRRAADGGWRWRSPAGGCRHRRSICAPPAASE